MTTPRQRLAALAAAADYPPATLTLIAEATLPRYRAGQHLDDAALRQVASAVEVLAEAGVTAAALPQLVDQHQRANAPGWRDSFWTHALHTANARPQPGPVTPAGTSGAVALTGDTPSSARANSRPPKETSP